MILSLSLSCPECGLLDSGLSTDAPKTRKPPNWGGTSGAVWDRWAEIDWAADKHSGKGGHPSQLSAVSTG